MTNISIYSLERNILDQGKRNSNCDDVDFSNNVRLDDEYLQNV